MIKFNLALQNMRNFTFQNNQWIFENGFIKVFPSPALEYFSISNAELTAFIIREKDAEQNYPIFENLSAAEYNKEIEKTKNWKLEYFLIEINNESISIFISRSSIDKVAVYYTLHEGKLIGSWDLTDLYKFVDKIDSFSREELLLFIAGIPVYSNKTIYKNIFKITERSKILFNKDGIEVFLPKNAELFKESALKPEIDPAQALYSILENQLKYYQILTRCSVKEIGCELSGGLDSAIVNIVVSNFFNKAGINVSAPPTPSNK